MDINVFTSDPSLLSFTWRDSRKVNSMSESGAVVSMSDNQLSGSVPPPEEPSSRRSPPEERGDPTALAEIAMTIRLF